MQVKGSYAYHNNTFYKIDKFDNELNKKRCEINKEMNQKYELYKLTIEVFNYYADSNLIFLFSYILRNYKDTH